MRIPHDGRPDPTFATPTAARSAVAAPTTLPSAALAPSNGSTVSRQSAVPASVAAARRILLLFDYDWDAVGFGRLEGRFRFDRAGFDVHAFPDAIRLLWFDLERFVDRLARRHRDAGGRRLDGVVSHHEQFGALAAAMLAERLGLPGSPVEAILRLQHKLLCRQLIERVAPEANVRHGVLPCRLGESPVRAIPLPSFVKPVKAAYSVLARRIDDDASLAAHVRFAYFERHLIDRLVRPFDSVCRARLPDAPDARCMLHEAPIDAAQFNLDGYAFEGEIRPIGVVDELMYPGTQAFLRFAYPSRLPPPIQRRALDVARRVLCAAGFSHGFFNMEFFYDAARDDLRIIEFNPRLASQLADLYARVDGLDLHAMSIAIACGDDPAGVPRLPARGGAAASCVLRGFGGAPPPRALTAADRAAIAERHPGTTVLEFPKSRAARRREMKWLGSNRHAVINLHGADESALVQRYRAICALLGWPAPY